MVDFSPVKHLQLRLMFRLLATFLLFIGLVWADTKTVAISYFDNTSGSEKYNPLSKGLADMLITDLSNVKSLKIVEREKLESLLKEIDLGDGKFIDPNTAQKLGKGLGAGYMLTGSFLIIGETMRIDARLVDVGTGEISMAEEITGEKDTFFELEKSLVNKLITTLNIDLSKKESRKVKKVQTESFESFNNYSSSIDAFDKGEYEKSKSFMEKAANLDEDFDLAWDKLEELEKIIEDLIIARQSGLDSELTSVINSLRPNDKDIALAFTQVLSNIATDANGSIVNMIGNPALISNSEDSKKVSKAVKTFIYVFDLYDENSFRSASYAPNMYIEPTINYSYLQLLSSYAKYIETDIVDENGSMLIEYADIDNIIINRSTKMMNKYPTGGFFQVFKTFVESAVDREKNN